jgi:hypothetical protein
MAASGGSGCSLGAACRTLGSMAGEVWITVSSGVVGIFLGGLGTELLHYRLLVPADRRLRGDRERADTLGRLIKLATQLEGQVDYMLSPNAWAAEGVFQSQTWIRAEGLLVLFRDCWRGEAEPLLGPNERALYDAVQSSWGEAEKAWLQPPRNPPAVRVPGEARGVSLSRRSPQVSLAAGWLTGERVGGTGFWLGRSFVPRRDSRRTIGISACVADGLFRGSSAELDACNGDRGAALYPAENPDPRISKLKPAHKGSYDD